MTSPQETAAPADSLARFPTPDFEAPGVRLYRGDCLGRLGRLPVSGVDAIVTDPPYCSGGFTEAHRTQRKGQGLRSATLRRDGWFSGDNMGTAGLAWLLRALMSDAIRVCRSGASVLMFCDWRMLGTLQPAIESAGVRFQNLIVWDKASMGLGNGFRCQHELILHFTIGRPAFFDRATPNVLKCPRVSPAVRVHKTQKPVALLARLLRVVCPAGGIVLDPFMGSASTGVAALETGRQFVGIEADGDSFDAAVERIERARYETGQPRLFPNG